MKICLLLKSNGQKRASLDIQDIYLFRQWMVLAYAQLQKYAVFHSCAGFRSCFLYLSNKGRLIPISYSKFQKKLKSMVIKTGSNCNLFSSHGLRRSGCSWAFKSHVNLELIQYHGDWLSDAYKQYLSYDFEQKLSVSQLICSNIQISLLNM